MTTMRFGSAIRREAMLGLLALSCLAPMRSASAQVATYNNYYEEWKQAACVSTGPANCQLVFSATPQVLEITDVSCSIDITTPINVAFFGVSDSATGGSNIGGPLRRPEVFAPQQAGYYATHYVASFKTKYVFGSGKWPIIYLGLTAAGSGDINCRIVGTLQVP